MTITYRHFQIVLKKYLLFNLLKLTRLCYDFIYILQLILSIRKV